MSEDFSSEMKKGTALRGRSLFIALSLPVILGKWGSPAQAGSNGEEQRGTTRLPPPWFRLRVKEPLENTRSQLTPSRRAGQWKRLLVTTSATMPAFRVSAAQ